MHWRLPVMLLATLTLAACGGRQAAPIAAEPIEDPAVVAARAAAAAGRSETPAVVAAGPEAPAAPAAPAVRSTAPSPARPASAERPAGPKTAPAGVRHILQRGQTLYSLARLYDVPLKSIMTANHITDPTSIRAGTPIFVPGARAARDDTGGARADRGGRDGDHRDGDHDRNDEPATHPAVHEAGVAGLGVEDEGDGNDEVDHEGPEDDGQAPKRRASNTLSWPLHGAVTGPYGRRGKHGHHAGIDIDGQAGDPILAAASGVVVEAGLDGPYGRRVVIDHGDGWTTLYAHAERLLVHAGDSVHVGQRIALVGRSGNARGTHLHFEVRHEGHTVNPAGYLAGDRPLNAGVQ